MPDARSAGTALRIVGLKKSYGRVTALDGLTLDVPRGAICGLVGPNGAGKTTTFGIVGGYIRADAGSVDILGEGSFDPARHLARVTLLPQDSELNPHTSVKDLLIYFARLQGLEKSLAIRDSDRVLDLVALGDRAHFRIRQLSHGMRRRVAVAQALLGNPELVLLDEPVSGLDPELVLHMRQVFAAQRGLRTLLISSHNLAELEAVCDHVAFMQAGRCVVNGSIEQVTQRGLVMRYLLEAAVAVTLDGLSTSWSDTTLVVEGQVGMQPADINAIALPRLAAAGARIVEVRQGRSLEAAYMADVAERRPGGQEARDPRKG
jgi:ABC-2 type transport system ATP-binding protein